MCSLCRGPRPFKTQKESEETTFSLICVIYFLLVADITAVVLDMYKEYFSRIYCYLLIQFSLNMFYFMILQSI